MREGRGARCAERLSSSGDPLFWSHAAFVNLLWNDWRRRDPVLSHICSGNPWMPRP